MSAALDETAWRWTTRSGSCSGPPARRTLEALLTEAETPGDVADATDVTERAARIVVRALADDGYFERVDGGYEPTNRALGFLTKTDVRSIGSAPHAIDTLSRWFALPETMETGEVPDPPENWTRNFMGAMASVDSQTVRASVTAAEHARPRPDRVLDVGGGPGTFSREFARRGAAVTLLDRPEVLEVVSSLLGNEPVDLVSGDALEELPSGFDLVFCSRITHVFGPEENRRLFGNCYDALEPGGAIVCTDFVRGRSPRASTFAVNMLAQTERGDTYTEEQYSDWLLEAGFEGPAIRAVPGTEMQAIVGHKG
ncbi:methyltransferase [Halalkalicoccus subterraneus]|uniref:methyltransferase n=1 Tax=Halalkalicoccus subterraneus TaxID=2675002 RepID=UPI001FE2DD4C|nr:methyltransferase [Halalkalicoccus subterraneus]